MTYAKIGGVGTFTLASGVSCGDPHVVMSMDNQVMFCANVLVTNKSAGSTLFTMPEKFRPKYAKRIPVIVGTNVTMLEIQTNGNASISQSVSGSANVFLTAICISYNNEYYNAEIGNVFNNNTSPYPLDLE